CQAEDGIRDRNVTGVQTCALPISEKAAPAPEAPKKAEAAQEAPKKAPAKKAPAKKPAAKKAAPKKAEPVKEAPKAETPAPAEEKIGRASCRERGKTEERTASGNTL